MSFVVDNDDIMLIENLKEQYDYIYMTEVCGIEFVWREITRREFKKLTHYFPDAYDREEQLCRVCVIEPENFDFSNCEAGIPYTVASQILYESGFSQNGEKVNSLLGQYREEMQQFDNVANAIITEAFPTISIDDIESWSTEKVLKYYAMAEYKLSRFRNIEFSQAEQAPGNVLKDGTIIQGDMSDFPELRGV